MRSFASQSEGAVIGVGSDLLPGLSTMAINDLQLPDRPQYLMPAGKLVCRLNGTVLHRNILGKGLKQGGRLQKQPPDDSTAASAGDRQQQQQQSTAAPFQGLRARPPQQPHSHAQTVNASEHQPGRMPDSKPAVAAADGAGHRAPVQRAAAASGQPCSLTLPQPASQPAARQPSHRENQPSRQAFHAGPADSSSRSAAGGSMTAGAPGTFAKPALHAPAPAERPRQVLPQRGSSALHGLPAGGSGPQHVRLTASTSHRSAGPVAQQRPALRPQPLQPAQETAEPQPQPPCIVCGTRQMRVPWEAKCGHIACHACWVASHAKSRQCPACGWPTHLRQMKERHFL